MSVWTKLSKAYPPIGEPVVVVTNAGYAITATWTGSIWVSKQPGGGIITHWRAITHPEEAV